jgi:hypothetical protein
MIKINQETHKECLVACGPLSRPENPIAHLSLLSTELPHYALVFDQLLGILIVSALLYYA